jgi:aminopeptidase-like protein
MNARPNIRIGHSACPHDCPSTCALEVDVLEGNRTYVNLSPKGEPQLGRRGLYQDIGGEPNRQEAQMAMLWVLNLSDGEHSLLDIAEQSGLPFEVIRRAAERLAEHELLK